MNLGRISAVAMFTAAGALGFAACSTTSDVEAQLQDAKSAVEDQAADAQEPTGGRGSSGSSDSSGSGSGGEGDAGSLEEFSSSNRADRNEGDSSALEDSDSDFSSEEDSGSDSGSNSNEGDAGGLEDGNRGAGGDTTSDNTGPAIKLVNKHCNSGKLLTQWSISDNSGVRKAVVYRYNEFNAAISSAARWMGPETGDGNRWAATSNGSQNLSDNVKIVAADNEGNSSSSSTTAPAGC